MPLDAVYLTSLRRELSEQITGMRIDKISQPERDMLILNIRGSGNSLRLLLSAGVGNTRIHLTDYAFENPQSPPMFCMLLRKHLTGAQIVDIKQPKMERIIELTLSAADALGDVSEKRLILECIGSSPNIILVGEDNLIIDCLRRQDGSGKRPALPGLIYRAPPEQEKIDPLEIQEDEFCRLLSETGREQLIEKWLISTFLGLSPLISREIVSRAYNDSIRVFEALDIDSGKALVKCFFDLIGDIKGGGTNPYMLIDADRKPVDFSYTEITQYGHEFSVKKCDSFSNLLESFFTLRGKAEKMRLRASELTKTIKNALDRNTRKYAVQCEDLIKAKDRDHLRIQGDIITANIHMMKTGMSVLRAVNFYSEDESECEIALDPQKTPQQNAEKFYKAYTKAKTAEKHLTEQVENTKNEIEYLGSVLEEISKAQGEGDLAEIRQELSDTGYIRKRKDKKKRIASKPMHFRSSAGLDIYVGKNNAQNDMLTKTAYKSDMWFHTQKIHGSHVIISANGEMPDDTSIMEAATLAAWYSQARDSANIPVDYTLVKHVKKTAGSRPGMVIYTDYKTVFVTPDEETVNRLEVK